MKEPVLTLDRFKEKCKTVGGTLKQEKEKLFVCEVPMDKNTDKKLLLYWNEGMVSFVPKNFKEFDNAMKVLRKFYG